MKDKSQTKYLRSASTKLRMTRIVTNNKDLRNLLEVQRDIVEALEAKIGHRCRAGNMVQTPKMNNDYFMWVFI